MGRPWPLASADQGITGQAKIVSVKFAGVRNAEGRLAQNLEVLSSCIAPRCRTTDQ
jgi:hypothetical protein